MYRHFTYLVNDMLFLCHCCKFHADLGAVVALILGLALVALFFCWCSAFLWERFTQSAQRLLSESYPFRWHPDR